MIWVHLVVIVALIQLVVFSVLVGKARERFGVKPPAVSGNENFERYYRVQMNTLELLAVFIPSIILAATYWSPFFMAIMGVIYLVGRVLFFKAYTSPEIPSQKRSIAFVVSFIPTMICLAAALLGTLRAIFYA